MPLRSYMGIPLPIQSLIGEVIGGARRLGFHGKLKVTSEGDFWIVALRVRSIEQVKSDPIPYVDTRELKRRARAVRG